MYFTRKVELIVPQILICVVAKAAIIIIFIITSMKTIEEKLTVTPSVAIKRFVLVVKYETNRITKWFELL